MVKFEWDEGKNCSNRKKHGVWFEEAKQVFEDPKGLMFYDDEHSLLEDRFIMLGISSFSGVLIVIFCERKKGKLIRIISARKATKKEVLRYEKGI